MKELLLLGSLAVVAVILYFAVARLDRFLAEHSTLAEPEEQERTGLEKEVLLCYDPTCQRRVSAPPCTHTSERRIPDGKATAGPGSASAGHP